MFFEEATNDFNLCIVGFLAFGAAN